MDYVWGCAMLIRAASLRQVCVFDERLTAYFEEADFGCGPAAVPPLSVVIPTYQRWRGLRQLLDACARQS